MSKRDRDRMHRSKPPPIEEMVSEFYERLPWKERKEPTADLGQDEIDNLRYLLYEEFGEYVRATQDRDLEKIADAIGDISYVAYGAAKQFGLEVADCIWRAHATNAVRLRQASGASPPMRRPRRAPEPSELARQWLELHGWARRLAPTTDVSSDELDLLERHFSRAIAAFVIASEAGDVEQITLAIGTVIYFTYVAALTFGFDLGWVVWVIHESNLTKQGRYGWYELDEDGKKKVARSETYREPDIARALVESERAAATAGDRSRASGRAR